MLRKETIEVIKHKYETNTIDSGAVLHSLVFQQNCVVQ